jgi:hypothetical protein
MGLFSWMRKEFGGAESCVSPIQQPQVPSFEQLEPRVLLSADASFVPDFQPLETFEEQVICVDIGEVTSGESLVASEDAGVRSQESEGRRERAEVTSNQQLATSNHAGLPVSQVEAAANLSVVQENVIQSSPAGAAEDSSLFHPSPFTLQTSDLSSAQIRGPPTEIIFIDSSLNLNSQLENADADGTVISVFGGDQDGIRHITEVLSSYSGLSAIHVISHGSPGQITLGIAQLNVSSLDSHSNLVSSWGRSLLPSGDILLYGCSVGQGQAGSEFVHQLSEITGADAAASDNPTGSADLGGDWVPRIPTAEALGSGSTTGQVRR